MVPASTASKRRRGKRPTPEEMVLLRLAEDERDRDKKSLEAVRTLAVQKGIVSHSVQPTAVLQAVLDAVYEDWLAARQATANVVWGERWDGDNARLLEEERALRADVFTIATAAVRLGLADRHLKVQEKMATLLMDVVADAGRELGLPENVVQQMPGAIARALEQGGDHAHR